MENENIEDLDLTIDNDDEIEEVDYKAEAEKWKNRYKSAQKKANTTSSKLDEESIERMVDNKVSTVQFYQTNSVANEHKDSIEELVAKGYDRDDAYRTIISKVDPTLLLDDQKKAQLAGGTSLSGVPIDENSKSINELTPEDIRTMPMEELRKMFPTQQASGRFYGDR